MLLLFFFFFFSLQLLLLGKCREIFTARVKMQKKQKKKNDYPLGVTLDTGGPLPSPHLSLPHAESAATLSPIIQVSLRLLQSAATCSPRLPRCSQLSAPSSADHRSSLSVLVSHSAFWKRRVAHVGARQTTSLALVGPSPGMPNAGGGV